MTDTPAIPWYRVRAYVHSHTPVQGTEWMRPSRAWIEVVEGREFIRWKDDYLPVTVRAGQERVLTDFLSLSTSESDEYARYAERWGLLKLCHHDLPSTHLPMRSRADLDLIGARPCADDLRKPTAEPVDIWRKLASQADSIFTLAGALESGLDYPSELWEPLRAMFPPGFAVTESDLAALETGLSPETIREHQDGVIRYAVQRWLNLGDVGFHMRWRREQSRVEFGGTGLAGALALQLALTITGTTGLFICSGCSLPYTRSRPPRQGQNHYCEDCRDAKIPERDRARAYRRRQAGK